MRASFVPRLNLPPFRRLRPRARIIAFTDPLSAGGMPVCPPCGVHHAAILSLTGAGFG